MRVVGDATGKSDALAGRAGLRDGRHADRCPQSGGVLAGARHLVDLPEGYHAPAGGQAWHDQVRIGDRLPSGRRVIGLRQVDEMVLRLGPLVEASPSVRRGALATLASADGPT